MNTLNGCLCGEVINPLELPSDAIVKCKETRMGCETEWQQCVKHLGKREAASAHIDDVIFPYLEIRHVPDYIVS